MANTLNGMTYTNIARMGFDYYQAALTPLRNFSVDFSNEVTAQGTAVASRLIGAPVAAQDLTSDLSGDYSSAVGNQTTTAVTVNLSNHPITGFHFTDKEMNQIAAGVMSDTVARMIKTHAYVIAKDVLDTALANVTLANYGNASLVTAASNFDSDDMADLRAVATAAGWTPFLGNGASCLLNPTFYNQLLKDSSIKNRDKSGTDALISGMLPNVMGFDVMEAPTMPTNSEYLQGFICTPDAIAIAMRPPATQASQDFLAYEVMTDDVSGASMVYAAIFNRTYRRVEHTFEVVHGSAVANTSALKRIVNASGS